MGAKEDHRLVRVRFACGPAAKPASKRSAASGRFNKDNLGDPWRRELFQSTIGSFPNSSHLPIDDRQQHFAEYVRKAAVRSFGLARDRPKQPWVSSHTWQILKWVAPLRRLSYKAAAVGTGAGLRVAWRAWRSLLHLDFVPGALSSTSREWAARVCLDAIRLRKVCWRTTHFTGRRARDYKRSSVLSCGWTSSSTSSKRHRRQRWRRGTMTPRQPLRSPVFLAAVAPLTVTPQRN